MVPREVYLPIPLRQGRPNEHDKCEVLEYLYAAALILVAAWTVPRLMNGNVRGISAATVLSRSLTTMSEELARIDALLRNSQESCEQAPKLQERIALSREVIGYMRSQSMSTI